MVMIINNLNYSKRDFLFKNKLSFFAYKKTNYNL